jgi:hypothetical protein
MGTIVIMARRAATSDWYGRLHKETRSDRLGQRVEAITLGIAILPLLLMDVVLHRLTSASIQGLKNRLSTEAVVTGSSEWRATDRSTVLQKG